MVSLKNSIFLEVGHIGAWEESSNPDMHYWYLDMQYETWVWRQVRAKLCWLKIAQLTSLTNYQIFHLSLLAWGTSLHFTLSLPASPQSFIWNNYVINYVDLFWDWGHINFLVRVEATRDTFRIFNCIPNHPFLCKLQTEICGRLFASYVLDALQSWLFWRTWGEWYVLRFLLGSCAYVFWYC